MLMSAQRLLSLRLYPKLQQERLSEEAGAFVQKGGSHAVRCSSVVRDTLPQLR